MDIDDEKLKECLIKPITDKLEVSTYNSDTSDLSYVNDILNGTYAYSEDIIKKLIDNIQESCLTIGFMYKCFYLVNTQKN